VGTKRLARNPRDRELLGFAAEHRFVLAEQAAELLSLTAASADARLRALARASLMTREQGLPRLPVHRITRHGLDAIGSDLSPPRLDLRCYEHDVGVTWLWLAARRGAFGTAQAVVGERRLRSRDAGRDPGEPPLAVRLGGLGPAGRERLHYPDLLIVSPDGRRLALELELTSKGRRRRERILAGYGADARIDGVIYLVRDVRIGRSIADSAGRLGISPWVWVRPVVLDTGLSEQAAEIGGGRAGAPSARARGAPSARASRAAAEDRRAQEPVTSGAGR